MSPTTQLTDVDVLLQQLRRVPLFAELKDEDRVCFDHAEERMLAAGELLVREGETADKFFVLLDGEISVSKAYGSDRVVVARYRPGAFSAKCPSCWTCPTSSPRGRNATAG